jgi:hypothetical protein
VVRRQKRLKSVSIGQVWRPTAKPPVVADDEPAAKACQGSSTHGILPHPPRHPVHAACAGVQRHLVLTFALAVFFLVTRGLHLSIEFTGGTVLEVEYAQTADIGKVRSTVEAHGLRRVQVQNFGTSRDVLIRLPVRGNMKQTEVVAPSSASCARPRAARSSTKAYTTPQGEQVSRPSVCQAPAAPSR